MEHIQLGNYYAALYQIPAILLWDLAVQVIIPGMRNDSGGQKQPVKL